ncbi:MAG: hypothetical protein LBT20_02945 [Clostridiales bacterium]|jgi:S-DNA-T family DNA segregation ATPase FtsK/SpoIIIE|nr:hypothetical protein [Clostridiales bacterium]
MEKFISKGKKSGFTAALAAVLFVALFVLVCLAGILPGFFNNVREVVLGVFGLAAYAYAIFAILISVALLFGYRITAKRYAVAGLALFFVVFVMLLQLLSTKSMIADTTFTEYTDACFKSTSTAGGLLAGMLVYHTAAALGTGYTAAIYAVVLLTLLLIVLLPYIRIRQPKEKSESALTEIKDGEIHEKAVSTLRKPAPVQVRASAPVSTPAPTPTAVQQPYQAKVPEQTVEGRREASRSLLYDGIAVKIAVDKSLPESSDMFPTKKKSFLEEVEEDLSPYTNNGRLKTLKENMRKERGISEYEQILQAGESDGTAAYAVEQNGYSHVTPQPYQPAQPFVQPQPAPQPFVPYQPPQPAPQPFVPPQPPVQPKPQPFVLPHRPPQYAPQPFVPTQPPVQSKPQPFEPTFTPIPKPQSEPTEQPFAPNPQDAPTYEGYPIQRGEARTPSLFGNDLEEAKRQIREQEEAKRAAREEEERIYAEEERARREDEYKNSVRKMGFVDDDADGRTDFVKPRVPRRKRDTERKEPLIVPPQITEEYSEVRQDPQKEELSIAELIKIRDQEALSDKYKNNDVPVDPFENDNNGSVYETVKDEPQNEEPKVEVKKFEPLFKLLEKPAKSASKKDEQLTFDVEKPKPIVRAPYKAPPIDLLLDYPNANTNDALEIEENIKKIEKVFEEFNIGTTSCGALMGPTFTRYEMELQSGIPVGRVVKLEDNISMRLASKNKIRIEVPIPGKNAFGIELPNKKRSTVGMRDLVNAAEFYADDRKLTFTIGKDIAGENYYGDLADMPHLLVAGSTGSGKSCCLNSLLVSFLYKYSPDEMRLILIDPKKVEFSIYEGLPHLLLHDIVTEDDKVINTLDWAIKEMNRRYSLIKAYRANNIVEYNKLVPKDQRLFRIVIVVDEVAELMLNLKKTVEPRIKSLCQLARAAGMHVILATQRPSVDVITGVIKSNLPSRIAFGVTAVQDSLTILGNKGAEKLLGKGDMLYQAQTMPEPIRLQGVFISNQEILKVVDYVRDNNDAYFDSEIDTEINAVKEEAEESEERDDESKPTLDPLFFKAVKLVMENEGASISLLQRRFAIGYARAARIIDTMEDKRIIGKADGSKLRIVMMSIEEFEREYGDNSEE